MRSTPAACLFAALAAPALASVVRDDFGARALAEAIRPHFARGVVLLTGNGHARTDIGVPLYLSEAERARSIAIGLLEHDQAQGDWARPFDVVFATPVQQRDDPCATIPLRR